MIPATVAIALVGLVAAIAAADLLLDRRDRAEAERIAAIRAACRAARNQDRRNA